MGHSVGHRLRGDVAARFAPTLPGLKPVAQTILGVFLWFVICLATQALPQAVIGVTAPLFAVLLAGQKIPQAFNAFSRDVFFLAFGVFMLVAAMIGTGLGKRIAFAVAAGVRSTRHPHPGGVDGRGHRPARRAADGQRDRAVPADLTLPR